MNIRKTILRRLLNLIPLLLILSLIVFTLVYLAPGDPALKKLASAGEGVSKEALEIQREKMGLNDPFFVRYGRWLSGILHGDWGVSMKDNLPVLPELLEGLKYSAILTLSSILVSLLFSIPLSVTAASFHNSAADRVINVLAFLFNSVPSFLLSVLLMYFFCIRLKLFPVIAKGTLQGLFLPTLAIAIPLIGSFARQFRAEILHPMDEPYVLSMRQRGVREKLIRRNIFHNAAGPIITYIGLSVGIVMAGSVAIETIFRWPGVGSIAIEAIEARDYPMIQGFVMLLALVFVLINLVTDIAYRIIDPRVRES